LVLTEDLPLSAKQDMTIHFTVADEVSRDGLILIAKGAPAIAVIEDTDKKSLLSRRQKLMIRFQTVHTVDGREARVRSGTAAERNKLRPVDAASDAVRRTQVKNKALAAGKGSEYIVYVDGDVSVLGKPIGH
jgi:hypothetical protein